MKIQLSIAKDYVAEWGAWEGVREIIQNYLDARDKGFEGKIKFGNNILTIVNNGCEVDRSYIALLGKTTKADDDSARGIFGEGIKLGSLALVRQGYRVSIKTGRFIYNAAITYSKRFGEDVLTFVDRKLPEHFNGIEVKIKGLTEDSWDQMKDNFIELRPSSDNDSCSSYGNVLTNESDRGKVFAKGIYVGKYDDLRFGYDFSNVKTDRDRAMVKDWDLNYAAAALVEAKVAEDKISPESLMEMMMSGCRDVRHAEYHMSKEVFDKLNNSFVKKYGKDAVPVTSPQEAKELEHFGIKGVSCPISMSNIFNKFDSGQRKRLVEAKLAPKKVYKWDELNQEEQNNIFEVFDLLKRSGVSFLRENIYYVDFHDDTLGTFTRTETEVRINLSKKILQNKVELLKTIIEEVAHNSGGDGSFQHKIAMHEMYSKVIAAQAGWVIS